MRACLSIILFAGIAVAEEKPEGAAKKEQALLQGTWKVVSMEFDGVVKDKPAKDDKAIVKGDKIILTRDGKDIEMTLTLPPNNGLKEIDLTPKGSPEGYYLQGIYKLEKDELVICYALPVKQSDVGQR